MLNFLTALGAVSLGGGAAILLLTALSPFLARRFAPTVRLKAWRLLASTLLLVPTLFSVYLGFAPHVSLPHAVTLETPQVLVESEYHPMEDNHLDEPGTDGNSHNLHYEGYNGQERTIEDNFLWRTITENGVRTIHVHWTTLVFLGWLLGAAVHFGTVWGNYLLFRKRTMRWAAPAGEGDLAALTRQQAAVGCLQTPALYRCPLVHTPLLMGVQKPTILLPEKLTEGALEPALAHELTHLKESHLVDKALLLLSRSLHWFNPLVWWMVRQAEQDLELCCDYELTRDRDEGARRTYGQAILDQMTVGQREGTSLTTGFSGRKEEVFRRFRSIMNHAPKRKGALTAWLLAAGTVLLSVCLVSCQTPQVPTVPGPSQDVPDGSISHIVPDSSQEVSVQGEVLPDGDGSSNGRGGPSYHEAYLDILSEIQDEEYRPYQNSRTVGRACLYDLDENGQDELLYIYEREADILCCAVWTFDNGTPVLVLEDDLADLAGIGTGGINLVEYDGKQYICGWAYNSAPWEPGEANMYYDCFLWEYPNSIEDFKFPFRWPTHTYEFRYFLTEDNKVRSDAFSFVQDDSIALTIDDFKGLKDILLDHPVQRLCEADIIHSEGLTFDQAILLLQDK